MGEGCWRGQHVQGPRPRCGKAGGLALELGRKWAERSQHAPRQLLKITLLFERQNLVARGRVKKHTEIAHGFSCRSAELAPDLKERPGNTQGSAPDTTQQRQKGLGKEAGGVRVQEQTSREGKTGIIIRLSR